MAQSSAGSEFDIVSGPSTTPGGGSEFDVVEGPGIKKAPPKSRGEQIREQLDALHARNEARRQSGDEPVLQALEGIGRGAISTVQGLASPIRHALGMPPAKPVEAEHTTAGKVGKSAEQLGEFFIPEAVAGKIGTAAKVGKYATTAIKAGLTGAGTAAVAKAQGDEHPLRAGAVGAAGPVADLAAPAVFKLLKEGTKASLAKVLGAAPTSPEAVTKAVNKVVPVALSQGLKATWASWLKSSKTAQDLSGKKLEDALAGPLGSALVPLKPVHEALDELANKAAQHIMSATKTAKGATGPIPGQLVSGKVVYNKRQLKYIQDLKTILTNHGDFIQARQLVDLKRDWDDFVYKAKSFPNSKQILTSLEARAKHTAANAIRGVLDKDVPSLAELSKAYSLNTRLYELIRKAATGEEVGEIASKASRKFSTSLGGKAARVGLGASIGGAAAYEQTHSVGGSVIGGILGGASAKVLETAFASPAWRTLPVVVKQGLADAIASGNAEAARKAVTAITSKMVAGIQTRINDLKSSTKAPEKPDDKKTEKRDLRKDLAGVGAGGAVGVAAIGPASEKALELLAKRKGPDALKTLEEASKNPRVTEFISEVRHRELMKKFGGRLEETAKSTLSSAQRNAMNLTKAELNATPDEMEWLRTHLLGEE